MNPLTPFVQQSPFEAKLFLEINSTQTNAKSELTQAINRFVQPFSDESIAYSVVEKLGRSSGPLSGQIVRNWYDTDKLKTTSVVSYAMKPLVKTSGYDSLFSVWGHSEKEDMISSANDGLLDEYIQYCVSETDKFLIAAKKQLPSNLWTPDKAESGRLITTTTINALLICFRLVIESGQHGTLEDYEKQLKGLTPSDFEGYHSSQYKKLAVELHRKYFHKTPKS